MWIRDMHTLWLIRISVYLLLTAALLATTPLTVLASQDSVSPRGLHDEAGVFNEQERAEIETAIERVEAAGAPVVVYLHLFHTEDDRAVRDGQRLMEGWDVQSSSNAHDGLVMFFNLEPDDPDRGEFGIVAGEAHYDDGALPQSRLDNIRDEMIVLLADDRMAEAIVLGLDMTEDFLRSGPPEPTRFETLIEGIASGPFSIVNALSVVVAAIFGVIGWRSWQGRPRAEHLYEETTVTPPTSLHPALAGALVQGKVDNAQVESLMLDLAQKGAIAFEPDDSRWSKKVRVRILNQRASFTPYELELLRILTVRAGEEQVLDQNALTRARSNFDSVQEIMKAELVDAGWFDPEGSRKGVPLLILGIIAFLAGLAAVTVPIAILEEGWTLIGSGILLVLGVVLFGMSASYPHTTSEGERHAAPWRGYRTGLKTVAREDYGIIDLDEAFPYIISMGITSDFHKHLEKASKAGYVPAWMVTGSYHQRALADNWFIYWGAFHGSMNPSSSGSGSGGAATGSGGSGGRF
jgi:uncharacterized protein (TIGR04222 family)